MDTPLHYAARHNNSAVVSALIENGARVENVNGRISPGYVRAPNINGNTALHRAAFNENVGVINTLVDAGADVYRKNSSGFFPLHYAVLADRATSISALVRRGANPNAAGALVEEEDQMHDCTGCNSIHLLVDSLTTWPEEFHAGNFANLLKALVDAGADINARVKSPGMYEHYSPLRLAVESELPLRVAALPVEYGAHVEPELLRAVFSNVFQNSGEYAGANDYRSVGSENNLKVLDLLIESRVDANSKDSCGGSVLHRAASFAGNRPMDLALVPCASAQRTPCLTTCCRQTVGAPERTHHAAPKHLSSAALKPARAAAACGAWRLIPRRELGRGVQIVDQHRLKRWRPAEATVVLERVRKRSCVRVDGFMRPPIPQEKATRLSKPDLPSTAN